MDLREIRNEIRSNAIFYVPKLKKEVTIYALKKEDGRMWGIGVTSEGKPIKVNIRFIEPKNKETKVNSPTPFPEEKKEKLEEKEKRTFEALRLLGRNSRFIKRVLKPEMENAMKKTMMVKYTHSQNATVRTVHYVNAALVAYKIAIGLFPNDEDLAKGIAICALGHDYGQDTFGHDGEGAAKKALKSFNAGLTSHGVQGALEYQFRLYPEFERAINEESIIEEEAKRRLAQENVSKENYMEKLKAKKQELKQNMDLRLEPELTKKIELERQSNEELTDLAIQLIIMSAGNHNGERGTAKITPDYSRTFEDFMETIKETGTDSEAEKKLIPHTIADSIAKLADQISSIPFDMIDGVRSGIEDEIPSAWVTPVSQILQITEIEARDRLRGNERELVTLALELQDKLIDSVVRCSNTREIGMDLDEWLYGFDGKDGLRSPNFSEHIVYTSTKEEEVILDNLFLDLTEKLSKELLDERGVFFPDLNAIFRVKADNPSRANMEMDLKEDFKGNELLRDFYNYCVETSSEEYNFHKEIVKKKEIEYFGKVILEELTNKKFEIPRDAQRGTMEFAIRVAMRSGQVQKVSPDKNGHYSNESINKMIENINAYLRANPIDKIDHLNVTANKTRYGIDAEYTERRKITDDQAIAARMAVNYLCKLNDIDMLNLGKSLKLIDENQYNWFFVPYKECSAKRNGGAGHTTAQAACTAKAYQNAEQEGR